MSYETRAPRVLVGLDGSDESMLAVRWAADVARRHGVALHLLHAYLEPAMGDGYVVPAAESDFVEAAARHVLDDAADAVAAAFPDLEVARTLVHGDPRPALLVAAEGAILTVVGGKGRSRFADVMLGSVALAVAAHGRGPVAVVPPGVALDAAAGDGPVLLGISDRADCLTAVGYAFEEAAVRGAAVLAALVVDDHTVPAFVREPACFGSDMQLRESAVLTEQLGGWPEKYPEVELKTVVLYGRSAAALVEHGRQLPADARPSMIVVGGRGRGGLTGMLLGSTGQALIAHSPWPVVIVQEHKAG